MSELYENLAAAYVRGMLPAHAAVGDPQALLAIGRAQGLKLQRFKTTHHLPRVRAVLGPLRGLAPRSLLDLGSGRGAFLWPLLEVFPDLPVTAVERSPARAGHLEAVHRGGVDRLRVLSRDAAETGLADKSFEVVTALELLEHLETPEAVAREAVRLAARFVLVSVPSKPDDNPEHRRLFDRDSLAALLTAAGATSVTVDFVPNHIVAVAKA